jgi:hypothetical protein
LEGSRSSIEDKEDKEVEEADGLGESDGEGTVELAEDEADVAMRLTEGLLCGRAEVVDIAIKVSNSCSESRSGRIEDVDNVF